MELLGFSLLASNEQPSSPSLRATEEEEVLPVRVDQDTRDPNGEARGDFATLLSLLFPGSSPEEGGKSWEQRGSTAFDQGSHVDALFPQSPEEAFPSSPESVPTHDVSSALSSPLMMLADPSVTEARLFGNHQEEGFGKHDPLLGDFFSPATADMENDNALTHLAERKGTKSILSLLGGVANQQNDVSADQEQRGVTDTLLFQALTLSEAAALLSRQQLETTLLVPSAPASDQKSQAQPATEPEQENALQLLELSSSLSGFQPAPLAILAHLDVASASASEQRGLRAALLSSAEQNTQRGYTTGFLYRAGNGLTDFSASTDEEGHITVDEGLAPVASAAFKPAPLQDTVLSEPPLSGETAFADAGRTTTPTGQQTGSPLVFPFSTDARQESTADVLHSVHVSVEGQHKTGAFGSQPLFSQATQTGRTNLVGQPAARSYPTENIQVESYGDATPGPTLPLDGSAEVKSRLHNQDTHPPEVAEARFARTHVTSAFPSPGETASLVPSTGFALPQSASLLIQPQVPTGTVVIEQMAEQIATHIVQGSTQATLKLEPQELGHVQIDLVLRGDRVQVSIMAETVEAGTLIQTHLLELKSALQQHNLELGTVNVDVNTRDGERGTLAQDSSQHFGPHNGGRSGEPPMQQPDTEQTERHRPDPRAPLLQQGVSVWA